MNKEQKQKFRELAKLNDIKGVPEGWAYVGTGIEDPSCLGLGIGGVLRMRRLGDPHWGTRSDFLGNSEICEYIAPVKIWNELVGLDVEEIIAFSKISYQMGVPAETVYIGTGPILESCFEFTEGHYCMDRREWEKKFGPFSQPLPDKFSVRRYWPGVDDEIEEHLMYLGYGQPKGAPDKFILWNGKELSYQEKSDLIPLPLEVLFSGEERKTLDIPELGLYIRGDDVTASKENFSLSTLINKLKENKYEF